MNRSLYLFFSFCLSSPIMAQTISAVVELSPAGSFTATSSQVKGSITREGKKLNAKNIAVDVRSLKSEMDLRDEHLQNKLEVEKYPIILLKSASAENGNGKGILGIKGQDLPIDFKAEEKEGKILVKFDLDLDQLKLSGINYAGVGVKNIVKVEALIPVKK
ncbi:MAG: YceI family protein [Bacteriovoracaceae bacterium]